jgi:hypothetical protein
VLSAYDGFELSALTFELLFRNPQSEIRNGRRRSQHSKTIGQS